MTKATRRLRVLLILLVVGVVMIGSLLTWADGAIHRAIEAEGTASLGVRTQLADMQFLLLQRRCVLLGLQVANPKGFDASHFLQVDQGQVTLSLATLGRRTVIPQVVLQGVNVQLEDRLDQANYKMILDHAARHQTQAERSFLIREVIMRDVTVHAALWPGAGTIAGPGTRLSVEIPEIRLYDVGTDMDQGAVMSQIAGILTQAMLTAVADKARNELPHLTLQRLRTNITAHQPAAPGP